MAEISVAADDFFLTTGESERNRVWIRLGRCGFVKIKLKILDQLHN